MTLTARSELVLTQEFREALAHLEAGEHLFLTGKAGTGKSTLVRHFLATTDRRTLVAAPTGIAALNVEGYTLHRLFSFGPNITAAEVKSGNYYPGRFAKALGSLDTLVIDEASMIRADLFDCLTAALERFGPKPGTPFGGVQIVLVGDLYQLPPVVTSAETDLFRTRYDSPYFFSADSYHPADFPLVNLTTVFRQVGDSRLVEILNSVREGTLLPEARAELNARTDRDFRPPLAEYWLTLTTTNRIAAARNREMLAQIEDEEIASHAVSSGDLSGFDRPTEERLMFKVGAQIMLLTNDPSDRWVNGTIGHIVGHSVDEGTHCVVVELPEGDRVVVEPHTWQATRPVVEGGVLRHEEVGTYTQLPFRLAWAITIHKSQGQTLQNMVVDLTGGTFADGQLYVALSRCTNLEGLVLRRDVLAKDMKVDQRIRRFLRSGGAPARPVGYAYLGVCLVGDEGSRWRPRPVEIAAVTDDGAAISTLIDPTRDLGTSATELGIGAADVQLAPTLDVAWPALASWLAGYCPVGVSIDQLLGYVDFELKRQGQVAMLPLGIDVTARIMPEDRAGLEAPTALERAYAVRELASRPGALDAVPDVMPRPMREAGYLLDRSGEAATFAVSGPAADGPEAVLAGLLRPVLERIRLSSQNVGLLRGLEICLGVRFDGVELAASSADPAELLVPGTRVCFTGTALDEAGRIWEREQMQDLAGERGLTPVKNVTKTKCDVLVAADPASQSGKMRKALEYGKPVLSAADFFAWTDGDEPGTAATPRERGDAVAPSSADTPQARIDVVRLPG